MSTMLNIPRRRITGTLVRGHGVASGQGPDCPYPGGSIRCQVPRFFERGLDLRDMWPGTLNVSTAPLEVRIVRPAFTFDAVDWSEHHPPESFTFVPCWVLRGEERIAAWVYRPDPGTKARDLQPADMVEVLAPWIDGLAIGDEVVVELPIDAVDVVG